MSDLKSRWCVTFNPARGFDAGRHWRAKPTYMRVAGMTEMCPNTSSSAQYRQEEYQQMMKRTVTESRTLVSCFNLVLDERDTTCTPHNASVHHVLCRQFCVGIMGYPTAHASDLHQYNPLLIAESAGRHDNGRKHRKAGTSAHATCLNPAHGLQRGHCSLILPILSRAA